MKNSIIRAASAAAVLSATLSLVSCETTGDPSTGGIFWSQQKADVRLQERQHKLNRIENRTERTRESSREKQREINRLKAERDN